jgi:hypothetical protein
MLITPMRRPLLVLAILCAASTAFAQSQSFSSLEERMSAKDFRAAGLDKLSDAELAALNAWIERNVRLADPAVAAAVAQGQIPAAGAVAAGAEPSAVESQVGFENARREEVVSSIAGSFKGWFGKTEFALANGQVWQQVEEDRYPMNVENPTVTIKPGAFGSWRLQVEGYNRTTPVKRIK